MNAKMNSIELRPIGTVLSEEDSTAKMSPQGGNAIIEIFPEYTAALDRIDENSHLWILFLVSRIQAGILTASPTRVNPNVPSMAFSP